MHKFKVFVRLCKHVCVVFGVYDALVAEVSSELCRQLAKAVWMVVFMLWGKSKNNLEPMDRCMGCSL